VVTPSAGAESAVLIAERAQVRTARSAWLEGALLTPNERNDSEGCDQRALRADRVTQGMNIQPLAFESLSPQERQETYAFTRHALERTDGRVRPFALAVDQYTWARPRGPSWSKEGPARGTHVGILYQVVQGGWVARRRPTDRSVMTLRPGAGAGMRARPS
jgi:hypothetical protein